MTHFKFRRLGVFLLSSLLLPLLMLSMLPTGQAFAYTLSVTHTTARARPSGRQTPHQGTPYLHDFWSGYVMTDAGGYNQVSATWKVPCISPGSPDGASSIWIGLGGLGTGPLVQTGTWQERSHSKDNYYAWVENIAPHYSSSTQKVFDVHCGDSMSASIYTYKTMYGSGSVKLIRDDTTDVQSPPDEKVVGGPAADTSTAEFIVERPLEAGFLYSSHPPLVNFGSVTLSNCSVLTTDGKTLGLNQGPHDRYTLINTINPFDPNHRYLDSVSDIDSSTESFTVTWQHPN